jgi:hypothetical protein
MDTVLPATKGFTFTRNLPLLNQAGSLGFDVSSAITPEVALALASETATFPATDIDLADIRLTASTSRPIEFARGADKVSFAAQGSSFAGFGIYRSSRAAAAALGQGTADTGLESVNFDVDATSLLSVLRWGYGAQARGTGAVALGAVGTATADVSGTAEGLFAVVRRFASDTAARAVVQRTADSWLMPRQIGTIDQVDPGTWIIAETSGGLNVSLGATLGYDFNWLREARLGGLTGDIGLRLQMGINAAVGFAVSGRCVLIVSRESDAKRLRLRLFRMTSRELDLSLNAAVGVQLRDTLLPARIDDFIAAVFGTHGQQILGDLKVLATWTDPKASLSDLLAGAGVDGAESLIATLAGTTRDQLQQRFDSVHASAVSFIQKWHDLPHTVASTLLKLADEKVDLHIVRALATQLSTVDSDELAAILDTQLQRVDFFQTPAGRFLESLADRSVLGLLQVPPGDVRATAEKVLRVLDGSTVEMTLLRFQTYVETQLHLDRIMSVVTDTDFAALDALLKSRLATFLGQEALALKDIDKVRKTIGLLLERRQEYYEKAVEALHRKYNVEMNASFQSATTDQALLDATFDFSHDPASVAAFFQQAVSGRLDELLKVQPAQVSIGAGKLTHGVRRQSHVDVTLPFMDVDHSHLNEAIASIEAVPHEGGLLMKVKSSDAITSGNQRKSMLSLAMELPASATSGLRLHRHAFALDYSLLFAKRNMQIKHVRAQVGPAIETMFKRQVGSVPRFLELLDRQVEAAIPNGPNLLGNGLISLDISMSAATGSAVGRAWLRLPEDRSSRDYARLSLAIQASVKQNIHQSVFSTPDGYTHTSTERTRLFLAYCALMPVAERGPRWFWDWPSNDQRRAMLRKPQTVARLQGLLTAAQQVLGDDQETAKQFRPEDAAAILDGVEAGDPFLTALLTSENEIVRDALDAGASIASSQNTSPSGAVKALARFGSRLTEAFHGDISTLLGPGIRSLGTRVLLDASRAIGAEDADAITEATAMLSIEFLKPSARFDDAALLASGHVPADQLAVASRIVQIALPA